MVHTDGEVLQEVPVIGSSEYAINTLKYVLNLYTVNPINLAQCIYSIRAFNNWNNEFNQNFRNNILRLFNEVNIDNKHLIAMALIQIDNDILNYILDLEPAEINMFYIVKGYSLIGYLNIKCPNETHILNDCINKIWRGGYPDTDLLLRIVTGTFQENETYPNNFPISDYYIKNLVIACMNTNRYDVFYYLMYNENMRNYTSFLKNNIEMREIVVHNIQNYTLTTVTVRNYEHNNEDDRFPIIYIVNKYFDFGFSYDDINNYINFFVGYEEPLSFYDNLIEHIDVEPTDDNGVMTVDSIIRYINTEYFPEAFRNDSPEQMQT